MGVVPLFLRELGPIERKVAWGEAYLHTKWRLSPSSRLTKTDVAENWGRRLELGCRLTQSRVGLTQCGQG